MQHLTKIIFFFKVNQAYRESNIYQEPAQVLSSENDLYSSCPVNQYIEPDIVVDLPKEEACSQQTSNNSRKVSNDYMNPRSVMGTQIQGTESSQNLGQINQNQYMNFKFDT